MLAIIIPTLNAQNVLPNLLGSIPETVRIVVSDGGSSDQTLKVALAAGAVIAMGDPGRGAQLARGAELAGAVEAVDAYLFLHADCQLPDGWLAGVTRALQTPNTAHYFRYRPKQRGLRAWWLSKIVAFRCWGWNLPYGDQGLLIPRAMYAALGGYDRDFPLFEDVDFVERIVAHHGRAGLRPLSLKLTTDVSQHYKQGVWARGWRNFRLLRAYKKGVPVAELLSRYT